MPDNIEVLEYEQEAAGITGDEMMDLEDLQTILTQDIEDAVDFIEEELETARLEAVKYYKREPFGDEEQGRSQYVSADVHDTIRGIMPDLLRIFFGSERPVSFIPNRDDPLSIGMAEQMTNYISKVVMRLDNNGFLVAHNAFHDALLKDLGIIMWGWEETQEVGDVSSYSGISPEEWQLILEDEDLEVIAVQQDPLTDEITGQVRQVNRGGKVKLTSIAPEEFLCDRDARTVGDARLLGYRTAKRASELIDMGFSWEEIEDHLHSGNYLYDSAEKQIRTGKGLGQSNSGTDQDEANALVLYTCVFRYTDYDGDGYAELRRFQCLGTGYEVARNEEWDEKPFALFGPDPEPHTLIGGSVAALVMDIQRSKSRLVRAMFDSLGKAVDPVEVILDGQVNEEDVENPNNSKVVREYAPGAYRIVDVPFVGSQVMPVLGWMDQVKVQRTGNLDAGKALTAEVLQSTTASAVDMVHDNSKAQVELIARLFAETGWKDLFKGILRTLVKHQDDERVVRLQGKSTPINPKAWDASLDVSVDVPIGAGSNEQRAQILALLLGKQEQIFAQFGLANPLFTVQQYGATLKKLAELAGIHDTSNYISTVPPDYQPPPPDDKPDPAEILAQAEMLKAQVQGMEAQMDTSIDWQKALLTDNRERDRMQLEALLKAAEITSKLELGEKKIDLEEKIKTIAQSKGK
jgi:hypothetical protein